MTVYVKPDTITKLLRVVPQEWIDRQIEKKEIAVLEEENGKN